MTYKLCVICYDFFALGSPHITKLLMELVFVTRYTKRAPKLLNFIRGRIRYVLPLGE
jgi:hypothetical protein